MIIYVDVLLFINAVINYAVLMTTERLMKRDCRLWRILLGSAAGAFFSLTVFLDVHTRLYLLLLKVLSTYVTTIIAFGRRSKREYAKIYLCACAVSALYCGAFLLFDEIFQPSNMLVVNDVVYVQVDPLWLTALTAAIYLILLCLCKLFSERIKTTVVPLTFRAMDQEYRCIGKIDTGCDLREPFSKAPVIIVDSGVLTIGDALPHRIIPYTAVGGSSYLNAVKAQAVVIDKQPIAKDVYIASAQLRNPHFDAVVHPDIIR